MDAPTEAENLENDLTEHDHDREAVSDSHDDRESVEIKIEEYVSRLIVNGRDGLNIGDGIVLPWAGLVFGPRGFHQGSDAGGRAKLFAMRFETRGDEIVRIWDIRKGKEERVIYDAARLEQTETEEIGRTIESSEGNGHTVTVTFVGGERVFLIQRYFSDPDRHIKGQGLVTLYRRDGDVQRITNFRGETTYERR